MIDGSKASSGIMNELERFFMAMIRNRPLSTAIGTNSSPRMVMYHAFAGLTTIEA